MVKFEEYIFPEFYTGYDKASDPNKDQNGKGTNERFAETMGKVIDQSIPFIERIGEDVLNPKTALEQIVPYIESELGYSEDWLWFVNNTTDFRRHLAAIMPKLLTIRGTITAHEVMFGWIGATVEITEDFSYVTGLDSTLRMDSTQRTWDSGAITCTGYAVELAGPAITFGGGYSNNYNGNYQHLSGNLQEILDAIYTVLVFNQPINADLTSIIYNGTDISTYFALDRYKKLNTHFA